MGYTGKFWIELFPLFMLTHRSGFQVLSRFAYHTGRISSSNLNSTALKEAEKNLCMLLFIQGGLFK